MDSIRIPLYAFILVACVSKQLSYAKGTTKGCSADPLIPEKPFVVVWNHPTRLCEDSGVQLDFQKWGIIDNDKDRFFGQNIVLFYNLGKWPYYENGQPVNGGLPQLADIDAHLTKVDNDLKTIVWNATFNGLAVIDMEYWRPLYWLNFDALKIYQEKSLALAKQRFPQYNKTQVLNEAMKEFDTAARKIMEETLIRVKNKRPGGKWGHYLYPRCWGKNCDSTTISNNDRMSWVFEQSTGLYPSIYFKLKEPPASRSERIKNTLHETMRIKAKFSPQTAPVMPYAKSQDGPYDMFQKLDLSYAILQPANMGSSGVVLWGSSSDARAKNECLILQDYIENTLGPYTQYVTNFFGNCTQQLCNGHGRCVRKDYERTYQRHLRESGRNDCTIPEDLLTTAKHHDDSFRPVVLRNASARKRRQRKNYASFRFLRYLKKYVLRDKNICSNSVSKMTIGVEGAHSLNFEASKQKTYSKYGQRKLSRILKFYEMNKNKSYKGNGKNKLTQARKIGLHDSGLFDGLPNFGNGGPEYDFDDYVCKCFPGFSGIHCENT